LSARFWRSGRSRQKDFGRQARFLSRNDIPVWSIAVAALNTPILREEIGDAIQVTRRMVAASQLPHLDHTFSKVIKPGRANTMITRRCHLLALLVASACLNGPTWSADPPPLGFADQASTQESKKDEKPAAPPVKLIEGERVKADDIVAMMQSKLLDEGDAVKKLREANRNNVRYNIDNYPIGYAIASEKVNDYFVFGGPLKGWRAKGPGEVSSWPPLLYTVTRKETMRQAKLIEPVPLAEAVDEMNNLRVYYRPLIVGHDGEKYQEQPSTLAFFIHPKTGTRMTVLFREGRSYGSIDELLVAKGKMFAKEFVPGRGKESSTLVPSIFYSKEVLIDAEPFPKGDRFDALMQAVIAAHEKPPLATEDFKSLFEQMSQHTGGKTDPVAKPAASQSAQRK
jgi:hypothetical protein